MILHLIERYYLFYWVIFIGFIVIKVIFSIAVEGRIHGVVDLFAVLLKWYDHVTRTMAESKEIENRMWLQNLITIGIIISSAVVLFVYLMKSYL